jgi:hypothetical protein
MKGKIQLTSKGSMWLKFGDSQPIEIVACSIEPCQLSPDPCPQVPTAGFCAVTTDVLYDFSDSFLAASQGLCLSPCSFCSGSHRTLSGLYFCGAMLAQGCYPGNLG